MHRHYLSTLSHLCEVVKWKMEHSGNNFYFYIETHAYTFVQRAKLRNKCTFVHCILGKQLYNGFDHDLCLTDGCIISTTTYFYKKLFQQEALISYKFVR